jgi:flagellar basal-body rod modification protein FlgD
MMEVTSTSSTAANAQAKKSVTGLADDFDTFLQLLTTQLQNQDPISPMDTDKFTAQLVQFTGVEQQIKTNDTLAELATLLRTDQMARAVTYLGSEVELASDTIGLGPTGGARVFYDLPTDAASVKIFVRDDQGRVIGTFAGDTGRGDHQFAWDGTDAGGRRQPVGQYGVDVVAFDQAGELIDSSFTTAGIVDGVELDGGNVMLSVGGMLTPLDQVRSVRTPAPAAPSA